MEINTTKISSLPIWVQLPGLDIKYWGVESLSKIGSMLGIPIKMDRYTMEKSMLRYARLLRDINLEDDFLDYIEFANDKDVSGNQLLMNGNQFNVPTAKCVGIQRNNAGKNTLSRRFQR